jgi:ketosteroid isomerase-like protein
MRQLTALFLFAILTGCNHSKIDQKAESEKLMQVSRDWARTASPDSIERTMSFWSDSAIFLSAGNEPMNGKTEIRKMVEKSVRKPGFKMSWQPVSASVSESGDMGYLIENSQFTYNNDSTGKPITLYGQAVTIWKKDAGGNWKNVVEASFPAPAQNK